MEPYHQVLRATRSRFRVCRAGIDIGAETKRHAVRRGGCPRPQFELEGGGETLDGLAAVKIGHRDAGLFTGVIISQNDAILRLIRQVRC